MAGTAKATDIAVPCPPASPQRLFLSTQVAAAKKIKLKSCGRISQNSARHIAAGSRQTAALTSGI
ncbi:MAG UNVERIFIED_CONTAM: hypothetical protein LVR18_04480 [Planctomycetaceae bacterium]